MRGAATQSMRENASVAATKQALVVRRKAERTACDHFCKRNIQSVCLRRRRLREVARTG